MIDPASDFHQIPRWAEDIEETAIVALWDLYECLGMPFGLKGAPFTCQRAVNAVINDAKFNFALAYVDDCVVNSKTFDEHIAQLETIFQWFKDDDLKFKPRKCFFFRSQIIYLGHIVTRHGVPPDPTKVATVLQFPLPTNVKKLQSVLALTSYFRKFISDCIMLATPLRELVKDAPFTWIDIRFSAFSDVKNSLCNEPTLTLFSGNLSFDIQVQRDASMSGLGTMLPQEDEEKNLRPVVYLIRGGDLNCTLTEVEALAIKWSIEGLHPYLVSRQLHVVADHHILC